LPPDEAGLLAVVDTVLAARDLFALQAFALAVVEYDDSSNLVRGDLQDIAMACGLLKQVTKVAPCGENCYCADTGLEGQVECLEDTSVLKRAWIAVKEADDRSTQ